MAIYKIFPEKSATLYSYYPTLNSGIDEILEISNYLMIDGTYQVSRPIIKFPQDEIDDILTNKIGASVNSISTNCSLYKFEITQSNIIEDIVINYIPCGQSSVSQISCPATSSFISSSVFFTTDDTSYTPNFPISPVSSSATITKIGQEYEYEINLKLYLANANKLPIDYDIYCYPLYNQWEVGTGRSGNIPITTDGASWTYTDGNGTVWYYTNNIPDPSLVYHDDGTNHGGGLWWGDYIASQSFNNISSKDINMNVTNIINKWYNREIDNNGFVLKFDNSLEFTSTSSFNIKYFSSNTHTIYPPYLEIKWDDWSYSTGSLQPAIANSVLTIANNKSEYNQNSLQRFRINVRDQYPARAFQTSSVYLNNKYLPTSSYYQIKDLDTEEIIIDFDTKYTKISCDSTGNYFDIYMNGLEPERYYKILIKSIIDNNTIIFDNNNFFKVVR